MTSSIREESGRTAKAEGHKFEHTVSDMLTEMFSHKFKVEGASNTKIDVRSEDSKIRLSVKNPSGKNTQIGLYTQKSFQEAMNITDNDIQDFISKFFGGANYADYPRHRMSKDDIDPALNEKFTQFLNDNTSKLLSLLATHGHKQVGDVNFLVWATKKNDPSSVLLIDLAEFKEALAQGEWKQNATTFEFVVEGKKLFHLQMKGSGEKFTNGYHSLMFHVHNNFDAKYVRDLTVLKELL
tara:strand:- start:1317 stop:2033 length:717 start_codon:yes stop_codon:yes gene_type:complete